MTIVIALGRDIVPSNSTPSSSARLASGFKSDQLHRFLRSCLGVCWHCVVTFTPVGGVWASVSLILPDYSLSKPSCSNHRVFEGYVGWGKNSLGWYYGFKLHLIINEQGELIFFKLTVANVDDRVPVPDMTKDIMANCLGIKAISHKNCLKNFIARIAVGDKLKRI